MAYHEWHDDWPHWNDLYEAQSYIFKNVRWWSGCKLMMKEKYGTIRYSFMFPPGCSVRMDYKIVAPWKVKSKFNDEYYRPVLWWWGGSWIIIWWARFGWWVARKVIFRAVKKWPHIENEILSDLPEWVVGEKVFSKYWEKM